MLGVFDQPFVRPSLIQRIDPRVRMAVDDMEQRAVRPVGVIAADINGLKMINDHLGHEEGNAVLCQAALLLRGGIDSEACVARMRLHLRSSHKKKSEK